MSLTPFLFDIKSHEANGSRHSFFAHQDVGLDQVAHVFRSHRQSYGLHCRGRELHA